MIYGCIKHEKYYKFKSDKKLKENLENASEFCDVDLNKFELLLQKGIYVTDIWIIGINLVKLYFAIKKILQ